MLRDAPGATPDKDPAFLSDPQARSTSAIVVTLAEHDLTFGTEDMKEEGTSARLE